MTPTSQQHAIAAAVLDPGSRHLQVLARAGTGKTTTMTWCVQQIWSTRPASILCLAFGAETQKAMSRKLDHAFSGRCPRKVIARTSHALGLRIIRDYMGHIEIDNNRARNMLIEMKSGLEADELQSVIKIYELIAQLVPESYERTEIEKLIMLYGLEVVNTENTIPAALELLNACRHNIQGTVSFIDMLDLPIYHQWRYCEPFDFIFVDEAQDLNKAQHFMLPLLMHPRTKVIAIGDPYQAIYRFRGAHPRSMEELRRIYDMQTLPLSCTFRCPPVVVELVQDMVKDYRAADEDKQGTVSHMSLPDFRETVQEGDLVLCRTNAPLVIEAIYFMRNQKACYIKGRDVSVRILSLLNIAKKPRASLAERVEMATTRLQQEVRDLQEEKADKQTIATRMDLISILATLRNKFGTYAGVKVFLEKAFTEGQGICFSTVHQAKGDEARNVYILRPDLLPPPWVDQDDEQSYQDELNIRYVAITRSMENLTWVE